MRPRSYIQTVRTVKKVLGVALVLSAFSTLPLVLPAAAARWPAVNPFAGQPLSPRVPSPGELAMLSETAPALPPRDRLVGIENVNTGEKAVFNIGPGGYVRSDQTTALEHFFRCRRTGNKENIHPSVLVLLADVAEHWPGRVIEIISGFRAPPFGVPHSRHFKGHAIDLRVRGVPTTEVRDYVWREHQGVGVGYYAKGDFVHVDSRTQDREVAWSGREESSKLDYNPRWASRARQAASTPRAF
jgi:uncharacterized protein YcbK (DUF882 family)